MILSQSTIWISSTAKTPNENAVVSPRKLMALVMADRFGRGSGLSSGVVGTFWKFRRVMSEVSRPSSMPPTSVCLRPHVSNLKMPSVTLISAVSVSFRAAPAGFTWMAESGVPGAGVPTVFRLETIESRW